VFPYFIVLFIDNRKKKHAYSLFSLQFVSYYYLYTNIMNKNLNNDSHQFHQYQQNKQSSLAHRNSLNTMKDHDIWHWKSRSWLGKCTKMWRVLNRRMGSNAPLFIT